MEEGMKIVPVTHTSFQMRQRCRTGVYMKTRKVRQGCTQELKRCSPIRFSAGGRIAIGSNQC